MPSNAFAVAADLMDVGPRTRSAVIDTTRHYGALMQTQVKANASGRPGPRVVTGQYRAKIHTTYHFIGGSFIASTGTNHPAARRLEKGFVGTDSRGRHYAQGPLPHFGPAADKLGPQYVDAIEKAIWRTAN